MSEAKRLLRWIIPGFLFILLTFIYLIISVIFFLEKPLIIFKLLEGNHTLTFIGILATMVIPIGFIISPDFRTF
jgi:membrane protein DedA with SNARE-associated domain